MSIVTIFHQKGGIGKSTVAYNLAAEFGVKAGKENILLLDLDRQGTLNDIAGIYEENGGSLPFEFKWIREFIEDFNDEEEMSKAIKSHLINDWSDNYPLIIIDTAAGSLEKKYMRQLMAVSDMLILPVQKGGPQIKATAQVADHINKILLPTAKSVGLTPPEIRLLWLRDKKANETKYAKSQLEQAQAIFETVYSLSSFEVEPRNYIEIERVMAGEGYLRNIAPGSAAQKQYEQLANEVLEILTKGGEE